MATRQRPVLQVRNLTRDGIALVTAGRVANNFFTRLVGLLAQSSLPEGDGLLIIPCNSIHSFQMRFTFDAIFLSQANKVVHLYPEMKPWRISKMIYAAKTVLEVPAGTIARTGTQLGDQLELTTTQ